MEAEDAQRAVATAMSLAVELGLAVDDAVVLNGSNRLVVRLLPCDTVARVTPVTHFASAELEVSLARQLAATDSPVATLDDRVEPRVFERDGFRISFWTYCDAVPSWTLPPAEYADALSRLHAGLRQIDLTTPHFLDRISATQRDVANVAVTPDLSDEDRSLLNDALRDLRRAIGDRRAPEQVLHGEPHPGNVLDTKDGLLFIDFENTTRGPVEYDLAWVPDEVCALYAGVNEDLLDECRGLVIAIIAMHRWSRDDQHPSGRESGVAFLNALRAGPPYPAINDVTW